MLSFLFKSIIVLFVGTVFVASFNDKKIEKPKNDNISQKSVVETKKLENNKKTEIQPGKKVEKDANTIKSQKTASSSESKLSTKKTLKKDLPKNNNLVEKKTPISNQILPINPVSNNPIDTDFGIINEKTRMALVNILCFNTKSTVLSPITGSGVVVSSDGVILTNAHIGQYFLLKDFNGEKDYLDCSIRIGSPAYPTYRAKLVYISPDWIENNKTILIDKNPLGTGEYDYSFLKITEKIDGTSFSGFSFLKLSLNENIALGSTTLLASYPAGFLGGISIIQNLYQTSAISKVSELFTFATDTIDLISVGGTVVSQKGSSGGAVVDETGEMIGLISTSGNGDMTSQRDLRAITPAYINRDLKRKTGSGVFELINNADSVSNAFLVNTAPPLEKILTDVVLGKN
jgi:S1-C subfamily serine protease